MAVVEQRVCDVYGIVKGVKTRPAECKRKANT